MTSPCSRATRPACRRCYQNTTLKDIAITRGLSDSFALRLANHKDDMHNRYMPQGKNARAMFDAVEQARIEAIGANAMPGVAQNLAAMLDDKYSKTVVNRSSNRRDTPLEEAVGLILRERLTGEAPPACGASNYVDLWRSWVEEKAHGNLDTLTHRTARPAAIRQAVARPDRGPRYGR